MIATVKTALAVGALFAATTSVCVLCNSKSPSAQTASAASVQATDTAPAPRTSGRR